MLIARWWNVVGSLALLAPVFAGAQRASTGGTDSARVSVPGYRARILGVYDEDSGEPIEGVRVSDMLSGMWSQTTRTGTVALVFLPDGGGLVRLQKLGYATQTIAASISPADTNPITVTMKRATELPAVVTTDSAARLVSPGLQGFARRMQLANGGYFIAEAELRKDDGRTLANVLATKPAVTIDRAPGGSAALLMKSPRCASGGPPQVYLDGVALTPDIPAVNQRVQQATTAFGFKVPEAQDSVSGLPFDLSKFNVSDLAGVEWYPDGDVVPVEFGHSGRRCGALMLWTRER